MRSWCVPGWDTTGQEYPVIHSISPLGKTGMSGISSRLQVVNSPSKRVPKRSPKRVIFDPSRPPKPWISETPDPLGVSRIPGNRGLGVVGHPRNHGFQYTSRSNHGFRGIGIPSKPWISVYFGIKSMDSGPKSHRITMDPGGSDPSDHPRDVSRWGRRDFETLRILRSWELDMSMSWFGT